MKKLEETGQAPQYPSSSEPKKKEELAVEIATKVEEYAEEKFSIVQKIIKGVKNLFK